MTSIELSSITGINPPYTIYACDIYGAFCIPIATISTFVPPPNTIVLPPAFSYAPAVGIKVISSDCERFEVYFCQELFPEHVCLVLRLNSPLTIIRNYFNFTIDENINGKPSYLGTYFGIPQILYWDGSQWVINPLGISNSNEGLFFGTWSSLGILSWSLQNTYCPSICLLLFDGVSTNQLPLNLITLDLPSPPPLDFIIFYIFDDGVNEYRVIWNPLTLQWELLINNVLIATLPILTDEDTPIGTWVLEPLVPYVNITTVLECPDDFKQFQNTEYFYFMDGTQYNFQS
jgi:hypothetical protein